MIVPALSVELATPGESPADDLPIAPPAAPSFQCPGEAHPDRRFAVHYQRLANGYARCHDCVHRSEHGLLPLPPQRLLRPPRTIPTCSSPKRIRGIVPNELADRVAGDFGRAIGQTLWHGLDAGETGPDDTPPPIRRRPPVLVIGIDARPSSPRLAGSLVRGLREVSGAEILDAGRIRRADAPLGDRPLASRRRSVRYRLRPCRARSAASILSPPAAGPGAPAESSTGSGKRCRVRPAAPRVHWHGDYRTIDSRPWFIPVVT